MIFAIDKRRFCFFFLAIRSEENDELSDPEESESARNKKNAVVLNELQESGRDFMSKPSFSSPVFL